MHRFSFFLKFLNKWRRFASDNEHDQHTRYEHDQHTQFEFELPHGTCSILLKNSHYYIQIILSLAWRENFQNK